MKKYIILSLIIILLLAGFLTIISSTPGNYVKIPEYTHSLTKAVCTEQKLCKDYEIVCNKDNVIGMTPTGAVIQFPPQWQDPRSEELRNNLC